MRQFDYLISFDSDKLGYGKVEIRNTKGYGVPKGITAVIGNNGSGKTTLATIIEKGRYAYGNRINFHRQGLKIKMLSFSDIHSRAAMEAHYFSQRMEATMNDMVPSVADVLGEKLSTPEWKRLSIKFKLYDVADKKVNYLSSGELRKLIIINALISKPDLLILDNPYIGLDSHSRQELDKMLEELRSDGISIVLLICDISDMPVFCDYVMTVEDCSISSLCSKSDFNEIIPTLDINQVYEKLPPRRNRINNDYQVAFEIRNGHVKYGDRQIIKDLDWCVKKGEQWALSGPNGCGKSLLLSMVCADNPQAYANDITLFDIKRGSGESIWQIKDSIGYVSPEMQLFFKSNSCVREIVAQGLRNSLNKYSPLTEEESEEAEKWIDLLAISHLSDRKFNELSSGEQRLTLVARAMIKQPELIVLDEPLHGLDSLSKQRVKTIVESIVSRNKSSLIFVTHYLEEIPSSVTHSKVLKKIASPA